MSTNRFLTAALKQTVTYWGNPTNDGGGGFTFDAPVEILGRWEFKNTIIKNAQGQEIVVNIRVSLPQDVEEGGYLFLGASTAVDPTTVTGAYSIKGFKKTPVLRGNDWQRSAYL